MALVSNLNLKHKTTNPGALRSQNHKTDLFFCVFTMATANNHGNLPEVSNLPLKLLCLNS